MIQLRPLYCILFLLIATTDATVKSALRTQQGIIYGRQTEQTIEYLGIQYARVIRWKPPIDLASEPFPNGLYDATSFGPCCLQPHSSLDDVPVEDEQCLYLNIYKPILPANHSLLSVFVFIHGGAHNHGCSSRAGTPLVFNGTNMIAHAPPDQPVIIVTINYRLSVLADMFLKELVEENPEWPTAGNYMYLDMLSALRWIQRNIRDYGGDPNNVSLFGQSAGGLSVIDLGAVRGSAGLYRTGISQSGLHSPGNYIAYYNMSDALNHSNHVVGQLNCTNEDKQKFLACLRNVSFANLLAAYGEHYTKPIIDNYFFPLYPPSAIQRGTYNNVSLVMGHNDYEELTCYNSPNMTYREALGAISHSIDPQWLPFVIDHYHLDNCSSDQSANSSRCCDIARIILTDNTFDCDIRRIFNAFYSKYGPEYAKNKLFSYHLNCYPTCPTVRYPGICRHSSELPFVFGTISDVDSDHAFNCTWDNRTRSFSDGIIAQWINIATTGRPLSDWPSYDPSEPKYFHLTPDQSFIAEEWNRNCSFFDPMKFLFEKEAYIDEFFVHQS